jgi:hypothetical protein
MLILMPQVVQLPPHDEAGVHYVLPPTKLVVHSAPPSAEPITSSANQPTKHSAAYKYPIGH